MSVKKQAEIWKRSKEKGSALLLLLGIADFADDDGVAFPAVKTLADKIRMSERNTRYMLKRLQKSGELTIETGAGPRGCNLFRVANLAGQTLQGGCKPASLPPAIAIAAEPSKNHQQEEQGFSEFWSAYPKKKSKGDARKAWKKLRPCTELRIRILRAIEEQKDSADWKRQGGQFVPHPATWLNGENWNDENHSNSIAGSVTRHEAVTV